MIKFTNAPGHHQHIAEYYVARNCYYAQKVFDILGYICASVFAILIIAAALTGGHHRRHGGHH